jgi:hypothetical protein
MVVIKIASMGADAAAYVSDSALESDTIIGGLELE